MTTTGGMYQKLWSLVRWLVLSGLVALVIAALFFVERADDELRRFAEAKLIEAYPHLNVRVGSARRIAGEGIRIQQISLMRPAVRSRFAARQSSRSELAYIEQLTLRCDVSLPNLLQGEIDVRHVIVNRMSLHLERLPNGQLDLASFMPDALSTNPTAPLPQLSIEDSSIEIHDARDGPARNLTAEDIQLNCRFKRGESTTEGPMNLAVRFDGSFRTSFCQRADLSGAVRVKDGVWSLRGNLVGVDISMTTLQQLPTFLSERLPHQARFARGKADLDFELSKSSARAELQVKSSGVVTDGQWVDQQLPQPVSNVGFRFDATTQEIVFKEFQAFFGEARISGEAIAYDPLSKGVVDATLQFDEFPITERLVQSLPPRLQEKWMRFKLLGHLSGSSRVRFDRQTSEIQHSTKVTCEDVSLEHHKFPYRVNQCSGTANYSHEHLDFALEGLAGGTPVTINGELDNPGPGSTGWYEVETADWKPIDDALITALPDSAERIVRNLQLRGDVGVRMRGERTVPFEKRPPTIVVAISRGWINYAKFPYPISSIEGRLESKDGRWEFIDFQGWNDDCRIQCAGSWDGASPNRPIDLQFVLDNVRMDAELHRALPIVAKQFWSQLRPRGRIDQAIVNLYKTDEMPQVDLDIRLEQKPAPPSARNSMALAKDLQIQPLFFPIPLENVSGRARLAQNSLSLINLAGAYKKTRFRTNGKGTILPDGGWQVSLTDCTVDGLRLDPPLLNAMPKQLSRALRSLETRGTFSLVGAMHFLRETRKMPLTTGWEMKLDIQQGSINPGMRVDGIFGQCQLSGSTHGGELRTRGQLDIESLVAKELQFTDLSGPIWIDQSRFIVGQGVPQNDGQPPSRPMKAKLYRGDLLANAEVSLAKPTFPFSLQMRLTDANVETVAIERRLGKGNLSGQANLELKLSGNARGPETFKGTGSANLRNANLYELPLILALLGRLGTGQSDNAAFTNSDVKFMIRDGFFYFDQFDLSGDTITLKGVGEMGMDRSLSLNFYSLMGREQFWSPLVRPFIGEASRQFLLIHVDGTLDNPQTSQEVLPGLNETLRQLFPEQSALTDAARRQAPAAKPPAAPQARQNWLRSPF